MKKYINIGITALFAGILGITSCIDERENMPKDIPTEGMSEISCMADLPQAMKVTTRGETGTVAENKINDLYVLVFDKTTENLISKSKAKNLTAGGTNENRVTFKATLPVGQEYTFMVLANTGDKLNSIDVGMNPGKIKQDVLDLVVTETGKWSPSAFIPMWGEQNMTLTGSSTPAFELTRMLARVNVELNLGEVSPGVPVENFQLTSIRYYNYNTAGALVPDVDKYDPAGKCVTTPTIPALPGTQESALAYDETHIINKKECKNQIYVFEAAHNGNTYKDPLNNSEWIKNPCLVIGGKYKTADGTWLEETFYRIDFIRKDNSDPTNIKDVWLSVLRNFSYNVVITDVSGSGFPDPGTALESAPINMEANILEWNESGMGEIVFDGTFYLSVSRDELFVGRGAVNDKREENILYVKTDYVYLNNPNHVNSGWYVEKYVDAADGTTPVTWLKLNPEKGAPNDRVEAHFTYEANNTGGSRTAIVWIAAGRLRYPVRVTQGVFSIEIVDPGTGTPLSELKFEVPAAGIPQVVKPFQVLWGPVAQTVTIEQTSPKAWAPFDPGWIAPNPGLSWTLTGNGSQTYQVTAPAVSASLIEQDPFYERESVYSFTLGSGIDTQTASITLHQIHYNIAVDMYTYRLDGRTYHISVRSNTDWIITNVEEWLENTPPSGSDTPPVMLALKSADDLRPGTSGGPNLSGDAVSFTVVNQDEAIHRNKWGTVFVTFESPEGKFNPVRVGIVFPARDLTLLGLGYARDVRAYNAAFPTTYHLQGLNRMLTSKYNFGDWPESTVKVGNFNIVGYNCEGLSRANGGNEPDANWNQGDLKKWLNKHNPDVITIAYSMILNPDEEDLLIKYMKHGGSVLMHYGEGTQVISYVRRFLGKVFETTFTGSNSVQYGSDYGWVYKLENGPELANDPIMNGPFGNVIGKNFGINVDHIGVSGPAIADKAYIYHYYKNRLKGPGATNDYHYSTYYEYTSVFRHKTLNLFYIGNGGGSGSYYPQHGVGTPNYDVMRNTEGGEFRPTIREGFGYGSLRFDVCNAIMYMNAMAWAIQVSNHVPPPGGY